MLPQSSVLRNDRKYKCNVAISKRIQHELLVWLLLSRTPRLRWVNLLTTSDAIWCHRTWSTLAQVMAWCLDGTKPSNEPLLAFMSVVMWHLSEGVSTVSVQDIRPQKEFESLQPHLPGCNVLMSRVHKRPQSSLAASNFSWSLACEAQR